MKNKQLFELMNGLDKVKNLSGALFAYTIIYNKKLIKSVYDIYSEMIKQSEQHIKYEEKRIALCETYANRDENGKVIVINDVLGNDTYSITDMSKFNIELIELNTQHKKVLGERQKQLKLTNDFLELDIDIELKKIKQDIIPSEITVEQMEIIMDLIE